MGDTHQNIEKIIQERLKELPVPVQKAITSTSVEARLRDLSNEYKLHLDQWQALENEVMLTLFGFQPVDDLEKNVRESVGVDGTTAQKLTNHIVHDIFEPIREELERELAHPEAKEKELDTAQKAQGAIAAEHPAQTIQKQAAAQEPAVVRAPLSEHYTQGETSTSRKATDGDPYREPTV